MIVFDSLSFDNGLAKSELRFRIWDCYNANFGKSKTEGEGQAIGNGGQSVGLCTERRVISNQREILTSIILFLNLRDDKKFNDLISWYHFS